MIKTSGETGKFIAVLDDGSLFGESSTSPLLFFTIKPNGSDLKTANQDWPVDSVAIGPDGAIYSVRGDSLSRQSTIDSTPVVLHKFVRSPEDGSDPAPQIVFDPRGTIFGYTNAGGANNIGIIYRINADGTDYKVIAHQEAHRVGGLAASDHGILYGIYQNDSGQGGGGFFALPQDGGSLTSLAPYSDWNPYYPLIYHDFMLYGCGRNSIFRFRIPRAKLAAQAIPIAKLKPVQPPPLEAIPIVFTNPRGEANYYSGISDDEQMGPTRPSDKSSPRESTQSFNPRPNQTFDPRNSSVGGPRSSGILGSSSTAPFPRPDNRTHPSFPSGQPQPPPVGGAEGSLILRLNSALDAHDYATVLSFIPNGRTDYFGHRNASSTYIERDIQSDARTYRWTKSDPDLSTFRTYTDSGGIVHESIQMETAAMENSGKRHHAFVQMDISYLNDDPPSILSIDLRVIR